MSKINLLFIALPYITAKLHIGRLMGTFLPADILARYYLKHENKRSLLLSGLDCYGTSVYQELKNTGVHPNEFFCSKQKDFKKTLKKLGIKLHPEFKTLDGAHKKYVNKQFEALMNLNRLQKKQTQEKYCGKCDLVLADRLLETKEGINYETLMEDKIYHNREIPDLELVCTFCKTEPVNKLYYNLFLKYSEDPEFKLLLKEHNVSELTKQATRSFLQWGVRGSKKLQAFNENKFSYYVWMDALCSYLELHERIKKKYSIDTVRYFYGKDNVYYHRIVYPNLFLDKDMYIMPTNENTIVRNHVLDQSSNKLSSSKKNFLTIDDFETKNYDLLRFGLTYEDCLTTDSPISKEKIKENCTLYIRKFVNTTNRIISVLKKFSRVKKSDQLKSSKHFNLSGLLNYKALMRSNNLKGVIELLLQAHNTIAQKIDHKIKTKEYDFTGLYHEYVLLLNYLQPITPVNVDLMLKKLKKLQSVRYCKETFELF